MVRHRNGRQRRRSLMPLELIAIIIKSMIPRSAFFKWLVLSTISECGPIDVISNPQRLKRTDISGRKPQNYLPQMAIVL